jgi:hypothetical protein
MSVSLSGHMMRSLWCSGRLLANCAVAHLYTKFQRSL